ncbi:hypothetical protein ACYZX9_14575 [Sphingomonas citri]
MEITHSEREVTFIVQVKDQSQTDSVAEALQEKGLHVQRVLRTLGVVGGTGPRTLSRVISGIPGVGMVREDDGGFYTPPPSEAVPS